MLRVLGSERPSLRVFEGAGSNSPLAPGITWPRCFVLTADVIILQISCGLCVVDFELNCNHSASHHWVFQGHTWIGKFGAIPSPLLSHLKEQVTFALRATLCGSQDSVRSVSKSSVLVKIEDGRTVVYKQSEGPSWSTMIPNVSFFYCYSVLF